MSFEEILVPRLPEEPKVPRLPENGSNSTVPSVRRIQTARRTPFNSVSLIGGPHYEPNAAQDDLFEEEDAAEEVPEVSVSSSVPRITIHHRSATVSGPPSLLLALESPPTSVPNSPPQVIASSSNGERSMVREVPEVFNSFEDVQDAPGDVSSIRRVPHQESKIGVGAHRPNNFVWRPRPGPFVRQGVNPARVRLQKMVDFTQIKIRGSYEYSRILTALREKLDQLSAEFHEKCREMRETHERSEWDAEMDILIRERYYLVCQAKVHAWIDVIKKVSVFHDVEDQIWKEYDKLFPQIHPMGGCMIEPHKYFNPCDSRYEKLYRIIQNIIPIAVQRLLPEIKEMDIDLQ